MDLSASTIEAIHTFHGDKQGDACLDELAVPSEQEQERMLRDLEHFRVSRISEVSQS